MVYLGFYWNHNLFDHVNSKTQMSLIGIVIFSKTESIAGKRSIAIVAKICSVKKKSQRKK